MNTTPKLQLMWNLSLAINQRPRRHYVAPCPNRLSICTSCPLHTADSDAKNVTLLIILIDSLLDIPEALVVLLPHK